MGSRQRLQQFAGALMQLARAAGVENVTARRN
jgi:hypothetical protein